MKSSILFIGAGQAGCTLTQQLVQKYGDDFSRGNRLYLNSFSDNADITDIIKLKVGDEFSGSGRDIKVVNEKIIPPNAKMIKEKVESKLTDNIDTVVLLNSVGGATGSSTNLHILSEILIPFKEKRNINIVACLILPSLCEGIPASSNAAYSLQQFYKYSGYVTIFPVDNDKSYRTPSKGETSFFATNNFIIDSLYKMLDYHNFVGTPKKGGVNTLDVNEYNRIMLPANGFTVYTKFSDLEHIESILSTFDINTAKKMVVLFHTEEGNFVTLEQLQKIDKTFPNVVKITAESQSEQGAGDYVEIIANGVELPASFSINTEIVVTKINTLNESKKEAKIKNKEGFKGVKASKLLKL